MYVCLSAIRQAAAPCNALIFLLSQTLIQPKNKCGENVMLACTAWSLLPAPVIGGRLLLLGAKNVGLSVCWSVLPSARPFVRPSIWPDLHQA